MAKPEKNAQQEASMETRIGMTSDASASASASATTTETPVEVSAPKKSKKLNKEVSYENGGSVIISVVNGEKGTMTFNFSDLPAEIQQKFGPFGLSHKLGDAAAGESGIEAEKAIETVWKGLKEGNWTVRTPAAPKIDKKAVTDRFQNMSEDQRNEALATLRAMGIDPTSLGLA